MLITCYTLPIYQTRIRCVDIFDTNITSSNWSINHSDINHNIDIDFPCVCPEAFLQLYDKYRE